MMPPNNESVSAISRETGVPEATLHGWKKKARANGIAVPGGEPEAERWSTQDKFLIVVETASLSEIEMAEYCRSKGLYVEQVEAWRDACMQANGGIAKQAAQLQKDLRQKDRELKDLQKELKRKEAALAETAALLVLRKKAPGDLGGLRGRLISVSDRQKAILLIKEAVADGAREKAACKELGITQRTLQRWRSRLSPIEDQRKHAKRPAPANKLSLDERKAIIKIANQPEFKSLPPSQIVPRLADQGIYIASESTFYRVLKENNMQHHRGRAKKPSSKPISTHCATGPNQVWMWDITWIPGPARGIYFYLYLILDLFSRKIIAWDIWTEESSKNASILVRRGIMSEGRTLVNQPLVLHSDNGSPMKGASLLETLYQLGITPSRSRPRVSNDNPYAESIFRTCKYRPDYPAKGFATLTEARRWVLSFTKWYNQEHRHSGLNFLTPNQRHNGLSKQILEQRKRVYEEAKSKHPERWSGQIRDWTLNEIVWLNPERVEAKSESESK
nr:IS3 family transposase [Desulfolucanica intricata]